MSVKDEACKAADALDDVKTYLRGLIDGAAESLAHDSEISALIYHCTDAQNALDRLTALNLPALQEENKRMRALLWMAYRELNEIRARDGVPRKYDGSHAGVSEEYWDALTEAIGTAAGTRNPWPDEFMRPFIDELARAALPKQDENK